MKILCCCNSSYSFTGSELYFYELCETLYDLGYEVTLGTNKISEVFKQKCFKFKEMLFCKGKYIDIINKFF